MPSVSISPNKSPAARGLGRTKRKSKRSGGKPLKKKEVLASKAKQNEEMNVEMNNNKGKSKSKGKGKGRKTKKRKLNEYMKKSLDAKKKNLESFEYKGAVYRRKEKGHLVFYKKD